MSKLPTSKVSISSLSELAWFAGVWIGEEADQVIEEHWSTPRGNCLVGMFRLIQEGAPRFYELMIIEVEKDEVVFRIKHFNPGLVGWEEKQESVAYSLVRLSEGEAAFYKRGGSDQNWMIYHREGRVLTVHFEDEAGEESGRFVFKRSGR